VATEDLFSHTTSTAAAMRDSSDVERTAEELRIQADLHAQLQDASTVQDAADALDVVAEQIGKSIVLMVADEEPVVVLVRGPDVVSLEKVAEHVSADAEENVRLAEPDEIQSFTGYPVGAVPPLGHERPLRTLIDQRVLDQDIVYVGGGSEDVMLEIKAADLRKLPDVSKGDFVE
jgi:Cys-tRNA(Pro) deacylase